MKVKDGDQFPLPAESRALSAFVEILRPSEGEAAWRVSLCRTGCRLSVARRFFGRRLYFIHNHEDP